MIGKRGFICTLILLQNVCYNGSTSSSSQSDTSCDAADGVGSWMSDGTCDPQNLIPECAWDGGDCCRCTCVDNKYTCGTDGYLCIDPDVLDDDMTTCKEKTPFPCPAGIEQSWVVENTRQVQDLAEAVNCSGGTFNVEWRGSIVVDTEIVVFDGTVLNVTRGKGFTNAIVDGGGMTRLFRVVNASLQLNDVEVRNGSATFGGAIAAINSNLSLNGITFTYNTANDKNGGAMFVYEASNVSFYGETVFFHNEGNNSGGAVYVESSTISWNGVSSLFNNTAHYSGGAVYVESSSVSWHGVSSLFNNTAHYSGGAVYIVNGSTVSWAEETNLHGAPSRNFNRTFKENNYMSSSADAYFVNNRAGDEGGAIFVDLGSNVAWNSVTIFSGNNAQSGGGGALLIAYASTVVLAGDTVFIDNSCGSHGGAISSRTLDSITSSDSSNQKSSLSIAGNTVFSKNKSGLNGGGIAFLEGMSYSSTSSSTTFFVGNHATVAGGGVFISAPGEGPTIANVTFLHNSAEVGGGASITGCGASLDFQDGELSAIFYDCLFIGNKATTNGGAIDSARSVAAVITNTLFEKNFAKLSGGALSLAGSTSLDNCKFVENVSGLDGGPAVSNVGYTMYVQNCTFSENAYSCPSGNFFDEEYQSGDISAAIFAAICAGCGECRSCVIEHPSMYSMYPVCSKALEHSTSTGGPNATLVTLEIEPGYWRASSTSREISACYNKDACKGGLTGSPDYCRKGYKGPYCSVCEETYVEGPVFACLECRGYTWSVTAAAVAAGVAFLVTFAAIVHLVSSDRAWGERWIVVRLPRRVPLDLVKIIIVAWQILKQFTEMVNITYPKAYQNFLNVLIIFNIDSWVRSAGCMPYMDFHLRFLIMTIGPILTVPILAGTYLYVVKRHGASGETLDYAWQKHVSSVLFIMFFVYNGASSVIFSMFYCDVADDSRVYLRVDYKIECDSPKHRALQAFAAFMVLVYPLGIPAFFAFLLFRNRRVLHNKDLRENVSSVRAISDLWKPYKPSRFYYEIIEFGRRLMLMLVGLFFSPGSATQVALTVMIAVIFAMMSEALAPYECRLDMWVNRLGHAVVILSMYFALLLKVNVWNDSHDIQDMFGIILITTHLLMILTAISEAFLTGCSSSNGQVEDSRPRRRYYPRLRGVSGSLVRTSSMIHDSLGETEIELAPSGHGRNPNKSARSECEGGGRPPKIDPITVRLKRSESV